MLINFSCLQTQMSNEMDRVHLMFRFKVDRSYYGIWIQSMWNHVQVIYMYSLASSCL